MSVPQKEFVTLSHCILNQNAVVHGLERARGAFPLVNYLIANGIAFIQLPCPELITLGPNRPSMTYEAYTSIVGYREKCAEMLSPILTQLQQYQLNGYHHLGVIGIHESPNCSITDQRGVLMEVYFDLLTTHQLCTNFIEVPTWYEEDLTKDFDQTLASFIEKGRSYYEK